MIAVSQLWAWPTNTALVLVLSVAADASLLVKIEPVTTSADNHTVAAPMSHTCGTLSVMVDILRILTLTSIVLEGKSGEALKTLATVTNRKSRARQARVLVRREHGEGRLRTVGEETS